MQNELKGKFIIMKVVIGIDVGGSTTKIVGFDSEGRLIDPIYVKANDQITSFYGALGKFTTENSIGLPDIEKIMVTGIGSSFVSDPTYDIPCEHVKEFPSIGKGGLFLSGLDEAIVVSMGTGTALVHAKRGYDSEYLGGTGVGGGTLLGLSKKLLGMENIHHIVELAEKGNLSNVDLRVSDITKPDVHPGLAPDLTASNFGKLSDVATSSDLALGIINMIFETVTMLSVFAARSYNIKNVVLTGNLTNLPQAKKIFNTMNQMFNVNFIIPNYSSFGTVIGAALSGTNLDF